MYPVGFPLWRWCGRQGAVLLLRVQVQRNSATGCYSATSSSLPGLLVRARTREGLISRVYACAELLLTDELGQPPRQQALIAWDGVFQHGIPAPAAWQQLGSGRSWS
ncbi:hypothetical protein [Comamonas sp. UBA7528]|jgi:hypothetical protein|uniref:hypothetical protein n=1 Tax=Comamonas sp. UBA7528 TaxID=1946391 RepID=UPI001B5D2A4E|nr:hypothetical protein [Comamonas sp. UBA7528]MBP7354078.1 hypothetical protein [Comamonas sp.]